ncbi:uncharacterized protein LOC114297448 [Camellia sinensis]|uniref:uncharacterized protein LOC114297448 n=1 Tax=Camellia sinensis TaxID=4442 RepID=UPI001036E021|nr:uncharacterized protein LOC114297448 [Camellia sinensis]
MARAIQKQHLVLERIHRLRQKANDTASQVESLQAELGRAKSSLEMANSDNNRLLGQLDAAEKKRDELQAEVDILKKSKKKACRAANTAGFNEAEESYKKQSDVSSSDGEDGVRRTVRFKNRGSLGVSDRQ